MSKSFANSTLPNGFKLYRYTILKKLSSGGFGVVYIAKRDDSTLVAIKEFLPAVIECRTSNKGIVKVEGVGNSRRFNNGLEAFFREADTLAKIHDDRVVAVWDVFEANGTAYFAMPIEKGVTLQTAIRGNRLLLNDGKIREIFIKACQGVEVLHSHGLLHLDLKPSNLWIRPDGSVVVLDLGASRWEDEEGRTGQLARTPGFAAPEQHGSVKVKDLTVRTDVYGLASTMYATLERKPPKSAPSRNEKEPSISSLRAGQRNGKLLEIIDKGMSIDPKKRWKSVQEMRLEIEKIPNLEVGFIYKNDFLRDVGVEMMNMGSLSK